MKQHKYPGELGRQSNTKDSTRAYGQFWRDYFRQNGPDATPGAQDEAEAEKAAARAMFPKQMTLMKELLAYYRIDVDGEGKWFTLAFMLARDNVPAFTFSDVRPVGRPKKRSNNVLASLSGLGTRKGKGRPANPFLAIYQRKLLEIVGHIQRANNFKGRGAQKQALTQLLVMEAKRDGKRSSVVNRRELEGLEKQLSRAKKAHREIAEKLLR